MATVIEGVMIAVMRIILAMLSIVVAQDTVVLQQVHEHLRYPHPLVHIHGAEAIESKGEGEEQGAHRGGKCTPKHLLQAPLNGSAKTLT